MKRVLIVYATVEGHTRKIAAFLAKEADKLGFLAVLHNAAEDAARVHPTNFEKVIVLSPVHMDKHHSAIEQFLADEAPSLRDDNSALLSVSVSAAGEAEDRYLAWEYTRTLLASLSWRPAYVEIVPGALKPTENDFFKRWAMRRLAHKKRVPIKGGDYEYTDWQELSRFINRFLTEVAKPPPVSSRA